MRKVKLVKSLVIEEVISYNNNDIREARFNPFNTTPISNNEFIETQNMDFYN